MALRCSVGAGRFAARLARRGLDASRPAPLAGGRSPPQARIADADRIVQRSRHGGHDQPLDRGRRRANPRGFVGECGSLDRDLRGGFAHPLPHLCPSRGTARQAGADRRFGRRCAGNPRHAAGCDRGRPYRNRRKLLCQPQLAAILYRGHQDARLRAVGAARVSRARQYSRSDRVWQQHPRPRARLFAVQAANCAAFAAAWAAGGDRLVPFAARPTVADGIATPKPVRVAEVLGALRRSRGGVATVAEAEIAPAITALGRLGLFVEPTAATAGAALTQLLRDGTVGADQVTVVVLTGFGLKAAERIGELLGIGTE